MEQLICKKNYYDNSKFDFDGKNYWSVLWGRRMYKITPKPLFEKNKIYNAEIYYLSLLGSITSISAWYLIKCSDSHRMFTDNTFEYFYTKEEVLKMDRTKKLKKLNENR
jgi:hypothetical protein